LNATKSTVTVQTKTIPDTIGIVGIGASAGGLEALELFLSNTPADTGLAWIIVQHLDPTQKAMLPELLQRATRIPVQEARQDLRISGNQVYVIAPNTELRVHNGVLKLSKPAEPRGQRLPVNILFQSLAEALADRATGVVLSGMGSDGALGVQAIKAAGGLTAAQQPDSAQFSSMPQAAITAGYVDIVAPPADLPARILAVLVQLPKPTTAAPQPEPSGDDSPHQTTTSALQQIISRLPLLIRTPQQPVSIFHSPPCSNSILMKFRPCVKKPAPQKKSYNRAMKNCSLPMKNCNRLTKS